MAREPFQGRIPDDRLYDPEYDMWAQPDDDGQVLTIGASAWGIYLAGRIIGFTSKPKGASVDTGRGMATVECAKTVIAVHAPVGFDLLEGNETLEENPDLLNRDPYSAGWMARGQAHEWKRDIARLVDARAYKKLIRRIDPQAKFL